jgi:ABC-type Fe3+ transport system substrate-binding protein
VGKIVLGDVQAGEADRDAVTMWEALGQTWWDRLFNEMQPAVVPYGDERTYADGLAQGKWAIGMFPPGSGSLQDAEDAGLPVAVWQNTLAEGSPRSGIQRVCPVKNAPHPAAAQLFANWSLMKDGQTALNAYTNRDDRASLRDDVPQGKITDDIWNRARDPNNIFVDDVNDTWLQAKDAFHAYITDVYNRLHIQPGT